MPSLSFKLQQVWKWLHINLKDSDLNLSTTMSLVVERCGKNKWTSKCSHVTF